MTTLQNLSPAATASSSPQTVKSLPAARARQAHRLAVVDDDDEFRRALALHPTDEGFDIVRAFWKGAAVDLTLTEFRFVSQLALKAGEDISYRELYDLVHGKGFIAGYGGNGYRTNVRTFIKRIRQKFRVVDPGFASIE